MIVAAALAMLAAAVPAAAGDMLVVTSVDASAYPEIVVDFVLPERFAAVEVIPAMVAVDGVPAADVVPVDPKGVVVNLVVDDGPAVPANVVGAAQGGAIELVRTIDAGTRIAVGTPSGLRTALTADPGATIARIAGIIAGAPAVMPLPQLLLDAAAALGTTDTPDRHLLVVLGGPLGASEAEVARLADLVASNGIVLHIVNAVGPTDPALLAIAEQSGGTVPIAGQTLASFDAVTAAISNRYRLTTSVSAPGDHVLELTIDGETVAATIAVTRPAPATPRVASSPPVPSAPAPSAPTAAEVTPNDVEANPAPTTVEPVVTVGTTVPFEDDTSPLTALAIAMMAALIAVASAYVVLGRRREAPIDSGRTDTADPTRALETTPVAVQESTPDGVAKPDRGAEELEPVAPSKPTPKQKAKAEPTPKEAANAEPTPKSGRRPKSKSPRPSKPQAPPEPADAAEPEAVTTPAPTRGRRASASPGSNAPRRPTRPTPARRARSGARRGVGAGTWRRGHDVRTGMAGVRRPPVLSHNRRGLVGTPGGAARSPGGRDPRVADESWGSRRHAGRHHQSWKARSRRP